MATFSVNDTLRRAILTGNGSTTSFAFSFQVNAISDIKVYVDGVLKTQGTGSANYAVQNGSGGAGLSNTGTGAVVFVTAPSNATTVTILSDIPLARTSLYTSGGNVTASSLENDFDTITMALGDREERDARSLQAPVQDPTSVNMTLPAKADRLGKLLGFNSSTGNPEISASLTAVQSLSAVTASINLLGTSTVIEDLGLLATSTVIEDMGLLATSGNITAMGLLGVSGVIEDMGILGTSAIVEDLGLLATSGNVTAMGLLGNSTTITAMGKLGNDTTIADMAILGTDAIVADMAQLANSTIIDDLAILANSTITDDMAILATSANVTAMGLLATSANVTAQGLLGTSGNVTAMGLLGTSTVIEDMGLLSASAVIEDMGILGTSANVTAMSNVSGSIANVNTVASNVAGVNSFAERYRIASSAPSSSLNVGDLYFDTGTNTLKVYKSSGWADAGSSVNGTSARFHYDISGTPTTVTGSDANSNTLAYDAGFLDVYVNGVRMSPADITTTSGSSVVFASALADGDEVDIVTFGVFSVANIVSTGALNSGSITSGFGNIDTGSSTITTTGVGTFGSLDISGNIDVDGVTNLDVTDIDGAVDMASTLNVTGALSAKGGAVFNEDSADVDFRVEGNGDTHALFVQGGSDHVGINNDSPNSQLTGADNLVVGNTGVATSGMTFVGSGGSGSQGLIHFSDATSGNARYDGFIGYEHTDRIMKFGTAQAEQVRIHSNGVLSASDGIALGVGTANTASNVLSDYEEGTWTPTIGGSGVAYGTQTGIYKKVGSMVFVYLQITITDIGSPATINEIQGLPFAPSISNQYMGIAYADTIKTAYFEIHGNFRSNSVIRIEGKTGSGDGQVSGMNWAQNNGAIYGSGMYCTDS